MYGSRKLALVGPSFFSYIESICGNLEGRGLHATFFDERHANSIFVKILYRIGFYSFFANRKKRHLDGIASRIIRENYTDVVLIDVEVCDTRFVRQLKAAGVRVHLYMWDSARNKPGYLRYLHLLDGKASFDSVDCRNHALTYMPLFAEDAFSALKKDNEPPAHRPIDLSFCGTLHSNRARRIAEVLDFANKRGLKVSLLLYFHSRWLLLVKSCIHFSNARFLGKVSTTGFSKNQLFELFTRSKYVIDFPHPGQVGLTARTFEVLRSGTRLITFNQEARRSLPATLLPRVLVVQSIEDLSSVDFSTGCEDPALSPEEDYSLSLDRFVDQLLELAGYGHVAGTAKVSALVPAGVA